ncbi:hypothetical protein [Paenibacillus sp. 1P07SE]|uniref:hypothetical protein n=1 Tax=Paenibacillus sp. 1P07SE TaxID=3132209 RepID=UPI0039A66521
MDKEQMKKLCHDHMHRYVVANTKEGWCTDGFVEYVDDEVVCLAVPCGPEWNTRAFGPYPYWGTPFGRPPLYPYPYYPRRFFARQIFPLAALLGLSLLPFY